MTVKHNWLTTSLSQRSPKNLCDLTVTINPYAFNEDSFHSNAVRVAKEICDLHKNVYILYSGGLDSEYIIKTFLDNKLPFTPLVIMTPFNMEELRYVITFMVTHNLKPFIMRYNHSNFLSRMKEISHQRGYNMSMLTVTLDVCDIISDKHGCVIMGTGEAANHAPPGTDPFIVFGEYEFYLDHHPGNHIGSFYTYDLALHYSYAKEIDRTVDLQTAKSQLYRLPHRQKVYWNAECVQFAETHGIKGVQSEVCVPLDTYLEVVEQQTPVTFFTSGELKRVL